MTFEVAVRLTPALRRQAAKRAFSVIRGRSDLILAIVAVFMGILLVAEIGTSIARPETVEAGSPITWVPVLVLVLYAITFSLKRMALHKAEAPEKGDVEATYTVSDEGLRYSIHKSTGLTPWHKFTRLTRFPDVWLLFVDRATVLILPAEKMEGDVGDFVVRRVRESGGKVK
jgi:hypothetical protein